MEINDTSNKSSIRRIECFPRDKHHEDGNFRPMNIQECAGCGSRILERWLLFAIDRYWHNQCLQCNVCHAALADLGSSCFSKQGMVLCRNDYMRMYGQGGACHACGQEIPPDEFITRAGGFVFHLKCFNCMKCSATLSSGDKYYFVAGGPVCEQDYNKILKAQNVSMGAMVTVSGSGDGPRKNKVGRPRRSRE